MKKIFYLLNLTNIIADFLSIKNITNNINMEFDTFKLIFTCNLFELLAKHQMIIMNQF